MKRSQEEKNQLAQLNCSICLDFYSNPNVLHCGHSFCSGCLDNISSGGITVCPLCRSVTRSKTLQGNSSLNSVVQMYLNHKGLHCCCGNRDPQLYCTKCECLLCGECLMEHSKMSFTKDHRLADFDRTCYRYVKCSKHDKIIERFCLECLEGVCEGCEKEGHGEHEGALVRLEGAAVAEKERLDSVKERLKDVLKENASCLKGLDEDIKNKKEEIKRLQKEQAELDKKRSDVHLKQLSLQMDIDSIDKIQYLLGEPSILLVGYASTIKPLLKHLQPNISTETQISPTPTLI